MAQRYPQPLSSDGVHPETSSPLNLFVLWIFCPCFFVIQYCLFLVSNNEFLTLAVLTNATPAFSTLVFSQVVYKYLFTDRNNHLSDLFFSSARQKSPYQRHYFFRLYDRNHHLSNIDFWSWLFFPFSIAIDFT